MYPTQPKKVVQGTFNFEDARSAQRDPSKPEVCQALSDCKSSIIANSKFNVDVKTLLILTSAVSLSLSFSIKENNHQPIVTFVDLSTGVKSEFAVQIIAREQEVHKINSNDLKATFLASFKEANGIDFHDYLLTATKISFSATGDGKFFVRAYQEIVGETLKKLLIAGCADQDFEGLVLDSGDETIDAALIKLFQHVGHRDSKQSLSDLIRHESEGLLLRTVANLIDCRPTHHNQSLARHLFSASLLAEAERINRYSLY